MELLGARADQPGEPGHAVRQHAQGVGQAEAAGVVVRDLLLAGPHELRGDPQGLELKALGITAEFVGASEEKIPDYHARGLGLADALSVLADSVPGFAWLISPSTKKFHIVNVFNAPDVTLTLGS